MVKLILMAVILTGCSTTDTGDNQIRIKRTLGWNPSPTSQNITGYKLYFGTGSSDYDGECVLNELGSPAIITMDSLSDPNMPRYTFSDFDKTKECFFSVSSFSDTLESEKSPEIRFIPTK